MKPSSAYPMNGYIPHQGNGHHQTQWLQRSCHYIHPVTMFQELLTNSKAETLMKANEIELLRYLCAKTTNKAYIDTYWNTIKIANRNGYKVKDSQMWMDYIKMLERCGKDILSPKYICPTNLKEELDRYMRKVHILEDRKKRAEDIRKAKEREASFKEQKEKFFGIRINDGEIEVKYWRVLRNTGRKPKVSTSVCSAQPTTSVRTALSSQRG